MNKQMFVGLAAEGTTDIRFLTGIVKRTLNEVAFQESRYNIDIYVNDIDVSKSGLSFTEYVANASREGVRQFGMMALAIHTDADTNTYEERFRNKILPTQEYLNNIEDEDICKLLIPIIPVRMTEAWMLADKQLLKNEIGTTKSDSELVINRDPEAFSDPKEVIENAIRIATQDYPKRRRRLNISELYSIIGDKLSTAELSRLESYRNFRAEVRNAYRAFDYI